MNSKTSEESTPSTAGSVREAFGWLLDAISQEVELSDTTPLLTRRIEAAAAALSAPVEAPVAWPNGCDKTVPHALRYLAENDRPAGGNDRFNSEHLYQLAGEIERMASRPLYATPRPLPSRDEIAKVWSDAVYGDLSESDATLRDLNNIQVGATAILTLLGGSAHG